MYIQMVSKSNRLLSHLSSKGFWKESMAFPDSIKSYGYMTLFTLWFTAEQWTIIFSRDTHIKLANMFKFLQIHLQYL